MVTVRAKFKCISHTQHSYSQNQEHPQVTYKFQAVYDDGTPENQRYSKATPSGSLEILVDNPDVNFRLGRDYYLDFSEVPEASA